jgi:hypothetical protein
VRREFKSHCYVPVKIVNTQDHDLLDQVVIASNNQNKMNARNLRSNDGMQRVLQRSFDALPTRWFYERKDGEFDSTKQYSPRGFSAKNYEYQRGRFRTINNEEMAKSWLSFIGFSKDASERINAFEFEEEGGRYEWLFEKRPNSEHWNAISLGPQVTLQDDRFEPLPPSAAQYLLSYLILGFVRAFLPSPQTNKRACLERLEKSGKLTARSSQEDAAKAIMEDREYLLNQILLNMKEVIVELYAWIFVKTYGSLDDRRCRRLLELPSLASLVGKPDFKSYAAEVGQEQSGEKLKNILFTCFEFIKEAVDRWMNMFRDDYLAAQRRIRFLHASETVTQLKDYLARTNEATKRSEYEWKPPQTRFLESLPKL